jgi:acetoin utilization protein AcuB
MEHENIRVENPSAPPRPTVVYVDYLIRDVMSAPVVTIAASAALVDAAILLRGNSIRHLPVLDGHKLVGLLTDRDIQRCAPSRLIPISEASYNAVFADTTVEWVMTRNPETVSSTDTLIAALTRMRLAKCGCFPVVDEGALVGILTRGDLLDALERLLSGKSPSRA